MTKVEDSNCDTTQTQIVTKLRNLICDKTQKLKSGKNYKKKTHIVTQLKNSNCDKIKKLKLWQNSKTQIVKNSKSQIVTKLKNAYCDKPQNSGGL